MKLGEEVADVQKMYPMNLCEDKNWFLFVQFAKYCALKLAVNLFPECILVLFM